MSRQDSISFISQPAKALCEPVDNDFMIISATSMQDVLAGMATAQANHQVQLEVAMAVMKQQQDMQEMQAQALIKMIHQNSLDGTGQLVNRIA